MGLALRDVGVSAAVLRGWARTAEGAGYSGIWVPEISGHDAVSTVAVLAEATERLLVGPGVSPVFARPPGVLAQAALSLDDVSDGRLALGLGTGAQAPAEGWFGATWGDPFGRLGATIQAVRQAARGEVIDVRWEHGSNRGMQIGFSPRRAAIPILVAALGPRMLAYAASVGDGVLLNWLPLRAVAPAVARVREAARAAGRRDQDVAIAAYVRVALGDPQELVDRLRPQVRTYLEIPAYAAMLRNAGVEDVARVAAAPPHLRDGVVRPQTVSQLVAMGTPEQILARVEAYRAAGVDLPILYPMVIGDDTVGDVTRMIEALGPQSFVPAPAALRGELAR